MEDCSHGRVQLLRPSGRLTETRSKLDFRFFLRDLDELALVRKTDWWQSRGLNLGIPLSTLMVLRLDLPGIAVSE